MGYVKKRSGESKAKEKWACWERKGVSQISQDDERMGEYLNEEM